MVAADPADSATIKFLCSYNGFIAPRDSDGLLRYFGGLTRLLAVTRSISYAELMVKLVEFCGFSVDLKCSLPGGDLETLVTIKSQEELANLIDEYDRAADSKIRAVLTPPKSLKTISPPPSVTHGSYYSPRISCRVGSSRRPSTTTFSQHHHSPPSTVDFFSPKSAGSLQLHSPPKYSSTRSYCQHYSSRISGGSPVAVRLSCRIPMTYCVGSVARVSCNSTARSNYRYWN